MLQRARSTGFDRAALAPVTRRDFHPLRCWTTARFSPVWSQGAFRVTSVSWARLGVQPIAVGKAEKAAEAQVGVGGDGALAGDDVADALRRHADFLGQPVLADAHRLQEFLQQKLARRDYRAAVGQGWSTGAR